MGIKKTLGGERLGAGGKMEVELHNYGRSSHNIGKIIRTDQAFGTLVPYYCGIGLNGTTFEIDLATKIRTLPTTAPIFGSAKVQIDVFSCPIRLYIAALHNNKLGVGMNMKAVKLPIFDVRVNKLNLHDDINPNWQQIAQDSLLAYTGVRGLGQIPEDQTFATRNFPAILQLFYYDVYKNYYANKQEGYGVYIKPSATNLGWTKIMVRDSVTKESVGSSSRSNYTWTNNFTLTGHGLIEIHTTSMSIKDVEKMKLRVAGMPSGLEIGSIKAGTIMKFEDMIVIPINAQLTPSEDIEIVQGTSAITVSRNNIEYRKFQLSAIDDLREAILAAPASEPFNIKTPENSIFREICADWAVGEYYNQGNANWFSQNGLAVKTYLSDRFNNWLSSEWIDGVNGVNEISAVEIVDGKLKIDALILGKKIFAMMNRVAVTGGSFDDWQEAVYGVKAVRRAESPIYHGGMSCELVFDEVVSQSASGNEPLGTLAGRGAERSHKGGKSIKIKCQEPSMIMIIGSITPRIDYSQGNKWWNQIKTMDDWHKPGLDAIGFQDLLTEEFAAFDSTIVDEDTISTRAVGLQTSWIQYQTDVNETFGEMSAGGNLDVMALNRAYSAKNGSLSNATTYIDAQMYNVAFADASRAAKNIWMQVAIDVIARRRMSAKQIPNL